MNRTTEKFILKSFKYTLSEGDYVVYKESAGFLFKHKYSKNCFNDFTQVEEFIEKTLKERKRYLELIKTLSSQELNKIFSDVVLLGLTPAQIRDFDKVEEFTYTLVIAEDWNKAYISKALRDIQSYLAEELNLGFYNNLVLTSECGQISTYGH